MEIKPSHPLGHFYSPVIDPDSLREKRSTIWSKKNKVHGIDFNDASHKNVLTLMKRHLKDFDYPEIHDPKERNQRFFTQNSQFSKLDSRALFTLLQVWKPKRMIEVGSGYSSLLTADVNTRFLENSMEFICIDPYPNDFLQRYQHGISEMILDEVQNIPYTFFQRLGENDILFIDSSHVSKTGSDVNYLIFEILPILNEGVMIHFHDIFLPYEYPEIWVIDEQRSWNEQYLVRALLMYSSMFKIVFGSAYAYHTFPELVRDAINLPSREGFGGGSLWVKKTKRKGVWKLFSEICNG